MTIRRDVAGSMFAIRKENFYLTPANRWTARLHEAWLTDDLALAKQTFISTKAAEMSYKKHKPIQLVKITIEVLV